MDRYIWVEKEELIRKVHACTAVHERREGKSSLRAMPKIQALSMSRTYLAHIKPMTNPGSVLELPTPWCSERDYIPQVLSLLWFMHALASNARYRFSELW